MSRNLRIAHAVLAGAQILVAGGALADVIGAQWAALLALAVGAGQAALTAYRGAPAAGRTEAPYDRTASVPHAD